MVHSPSLVYQRMRLVRQLITKSGFLRYSSGNLPNVSSESSAGEVKQLNKGRLDWLFGDGYRRPLAFDQGQKMRRNWVAHGYHPTDEHVDWYTHHWVCFVFFTLIFPFCTVLLYYASDWPDLHNWAEREAYLEMERRRQAGLPLISKDFVNPKIIAKHLPTDEELGDFKIII